MVKQMVKHFVCLTTFFLSGSWEGYTYRQGTPMEESPVHCRAICGFGALFKGFLSSALKEFLHLPNDQKVSEDHWEGQVRRKAHVKFLLSSIYQELPQWKKCPLIQRNIPIFTFPHLYTEWSIVLCKRGHMDRWLHHPLLKGVNAENICWGNQYAPPSSLCNITPFDWHSALKGRWKKQLKHNQWWTDDVWKRFRGSINTLLLWLFT